MSCRCSIVPPHLLRGIAESSHNPDHVRKAAERSLAAHNHITSARRQRLANLTQPRGNRNATAAQTSPFIPESLLARLSTSKSVDEATRTRATRDLRHLHELMAKGPTAQEGLATDEKAPEEPSKEAPYRAVYNAKSLSTSSNGDNDNLPGELERAEGEPVVEDKDVNQAFDNVGHVLDFYKQHCDWKSIDNKNANVISSVHFGNDYENAFWFPEKRQMVFGDGSHFLRNFTGCIDVIGHELTHAVTEYTSPLEYSDQSGALNEHIADVFGIMVKQQVENEQAENADWLIGEYCLLPGVKGVALRSMKNPGTAYDDPRFGKDPQVDNLDKYEATTEDNGGVHVYSGIPNKAFFLASVAFGGYSWEKAGKIWWKAMNCGKVPARCTFQQFADVTVECAQELFDEEAAKTVRKAWNDVGVIRSI